MKIKVKRIVAATIMLVGLVATSASASKFNHDSWKNSFCGYTAGYAWTQVTGVPKNHYTRASIDGIGSSSTVYGKRYTQTDIVRGWGVFSHSYNFL